MSQWLNIALNISPLSTILFCPIKLQIFTQDKNIYIPRHEIILYRPKIMLPESQLNFNFPILINTRSLIQNKFKTKYFLPVFKQKIIKTRNDYIRLDVYVYSGAYGRQYQMKWQHP